MQYPQPLHTSFCTKTEPTSVRTIEPVGQASRQPASSQCLQTSERKIQRNGSSAFAEASADRSPSPLPNECEPTIWFPFCRSCSTNITCRHVDAPRWPVLSYELPDQTKPSSGTWFHSLHATSHALQPMHTVGSVKKPTSTFSRTYVCRRWFVLFVPSPIIFLHSDNPDWGAHASRVLVSASRRNDFCFWSRKQARMEMHEESSRSRGRARQHARRVRSPESRAHSVPSVA